MTKVLSVTSECVPFIKTGGLADVAGALPGALAPLGVEMQTVLPGYRAVLSAVEGSRPKEVWAEPKLFGGPGRLLACEAEGLKLLVLDAPHLFDRAGSPYLDASGRDWQDNPERFAALSWAAVAFARGKGGHDLIHAHDWQGGLACYYAAKAGRPPSIITVHNIAFHGLAPADRFDGLRLDTADFAGDKLEFWGHISALKAGLVYADKITTVSPTYAQELVQPEFGMGLEGVIQARRGDLVGILNGIDDGVWDPAGDPLIKRYKTARGKGPAKTALRAEFDLPGSEGPLCVVVSRLSQQKGLDLLLQALPALVDQGGQLALLGSGDPGLESAWRAAAEHPNVAVRIGYDEALSHRMMAGADAILIPSRFEPCGLTQLYGLRYGTIPVVSYTGGLVDTVINASPVALDAGVATGLQFNPVSADALAQALMKLAELYVDGPTWAKMQKNAMSQEVGWGRSAARYAELYKSVAA